MGGPRRGLSRGSRRRGDAMKDVIVGKVVEERNDTSVLERCRREEAVQRQSPVESIYEFVAERVDQPPAALP